MASTKYARYTSVQATPQTVPLPDTQQVQNAAGGYVFPVTKWVQLDRFLVTGSEGGTYYISEQKLSLDNVKNILACIAEDGQRVVNRVVQVSTAGLAPKVSPALYVLALCIRKGDIETRKMAYAVLPSVCRTASYLFELVENCVQMGVMGMGFRKAIADWYNGHKAANLAYQVVKYRNRNGWTHRDLLRTAHAKPATPAINSIFAYIKNGWSNELVQEDLKVIDAFEAAQKATNVVEVVRLIKEYRLPWEAIDNKWFSEPTVWLAFLETMGVTAMLRNLGRMTSNGVIAADSEAERLIVAGLTKERVQGGRLHPMMILNTSRVYEQGYGERGKLTWEPSTKILAALDRAFYDSLKNVEPINGRVLMGYDVSGSMAGSTVLGIPGLMATDACAALALMFNAMTPNLINTAFDYNTYPVTITGDMSISQVRTEIWRHGGGGTDCAQPILYALKNRIPVDAFVVVTDNETWYGSIHPIQAVRKYRQAMNLATKLVSIAVTPSNYSISDSDDAGCMAVAGFDASVAGVVAQFVREKITV